ncbi:MAG: L-lactate dehydrogenase [Sodalis sp.]|nr:MAG: L-lactate dehydrogenase [Sodalis sp.]
MIGRAFLYNLSTLGEACVTLCLDPLRKEMKSTMALCDVTRIDAMSPQHIVDYPWP